VVPDAWLADTARGAPDGPQAFVGGDNPPGYPSGAHYRNCWWVRDPTRPFLVATGIYGQNIYVLPAHDLVVAKFSTWPTPLSETFASITLAAVEAIARELGGGH
jgi:CubicO group peptidase (beta-lactamase class C family)